MALAVSVLCPPSQALAAPWLLPILGDPCLAWVIRALEAVEAEVTLVAAPGALPEGLLEAWVKEGLIARKPMVSDTPGPNVLRGDAPLELPARISTLLKRGGPDTPSLVLVDRTSQARIEQAARQEINGAWMEAGVGFEDPEATRVGPRVRLGADVELATQVRLEGAVVVGPRTRIGQGCVLKDITVGADAEFRPYCVAQASQVGDGVKIGPFAHLREGSVLEADVHVGNFVETKKATLRKGAKANHLTYLGDAEVGERTNIGAGCITCNYDGARKHRTVIGADVFVGSDCQLVAPVTIGDGAMVAAGTTLTQDLPAGDLAISRAELVVKPEGSRRFRAKLRSLGYSVK